MAGFLKINVIAEHFAQSIVNTFCYRSVEWNPLGGDPFGDALKVMDDFWTNVQSEWLNSFNANYRVLRMEGTVHGNTFNIVNNSPAVRTVDATGLNTASTAQETSGSSVCAILGWYLGQQTNISGIGQSPRNRGYIALGPVPEVFVDSYGHFDPDYITQINSLAAKLDDQLIDIPLTSTFIPVRIHQKFGPKILGLPRVVLYRTYSDVIGYRLPRVASWRRSRMPEA